MRFTSDPWWDWEYVPWTGTGPAIAQIGRYMAILDADDEQARELVASWDLPEHFATRGVSYSKGVVTEHHYFRCFEGLERQLGMCPGLDLLANPDGQELWVKVFDEGYEVLSDQPGRRVPALPDHVVSLHRQAAEERRQRSAADGEVPVGRYRAEGIEYGQQNPELYRSACSLAARRAQPAEIISVLTEIVEHSETDPGPLAGRPARQHGRPGLPVVRQAAHRREAAGDGGPGPGPVPGPGPGPGRASTRPRTRTGPEPEQENLPRHAAVPRLRVAPPAELAEWADEVVQTVLAPIRKMTDAARPADPGAEDAQWGDMSKALSSVELAAEVLGWLGDLDLVDYQRAEAILRSVVLPAEYTDTLESDMRAAGDEIFGVRFLDGWNKGAAEGHEVPAGLQPALDAWHPPCPIPREDIEQHRLPPGRGDAGRSRTTSRRPTTAVMPAACWTTTATGSCSPTARPAWANTPSMASGGWMLHSGGRGLVSEFADKTIGALAVTEAMSLSVAVSRIDKDGNPVSDRGQYWAWLNAQQSDAKRTAMIRSAAAIEDMRVRPSVFDADPRWLNTPSGELDLGRAEVDDDGKWRVAEPVVFHPGMHYPEHRHTRITAAALRPVGHLPGVGAGDEGLAR